MKRNKRTPAAREYFHAFYEKNHLHFAVGMAFTVLSLCLQFLVSWVLGAVMDTITTGDLGRLRTILLLMVGVMVLNILLDVGYYGGRALFIHQALRQYKALAFRKLSEKSISAFSQENTGRYLSTLTNDVTAIETDYLQNSFDLLMQVLLFFGALAMMRWYSPTLTLLAVVLSLPPIVLSLLTGGPMAKRAKDVSDRNEGFMAQIKDLLSGFAVIKSFKAEKEVGKLFDSANRAVEDAKRRRRYFEGGVRCLSGILDTLYQNITMFRDFPEDKLELAVHRSGLDGLIAEKGEGYRCGENGSGLSGGERQRVSIARCLMRETPVLLLDEATAALDNQTAFAVTNAILRLDGLTRVVVTHRLEEALLEQYDGIFVLRNGTVCEAGRFGELMERKAYFYSLYTVANG